jgi:hypothetical protein
MKMMVVQELIHVQKEVAHKAAPNATRAETHARISKQDGAINKIYVITIQM